MKKKRKCLCSPFIKIKEYFKGVYNVCGFKFFIFLLISQFLIKGLLYNLSSSILLPIFKNLGSTPSDLQMYSVIISTPWTLKSIFGLLSDLFPILGFHKKYWIIQAIVIGVIGSSLSFFSNSIVFYIICFVMLNYEIATIDLLTESRYAEIIRENPKFSSDINTFIYSLQVLGGLLAISIVGPLSDEKLFWVVFIVIVIISFVPLIPTFFDFLPEEKDGSKIIGFSKNIFVKYRSIIIVVVFSGLSSIVVSILTIFNNKILTLLCSLFLLLASVIGCYLSFDRVIANTVLYLTVSNLSRPSMKTALDFFFTSVCCENCPKFTFKFYILYSGLISAFISIFALWLYQICLSNWKIRSVLIFTICLSSFGALFDFLIVSRINIYFKIPDYLFFTFGDAIIETVVGVLAWIPTSILISKVCPKGIETIIFAFLASISNFSKIVSDISGALIFNSFGVTKCNFDNLHWLILLFHCITPLLISIPCSFVIPNVRQDEKMIDEEIEEFEIKELKIKKEKEEFDDNIELSSFSEEFFDQVLFFEEEIF